MTEFREMSRDDKRHLRERLRSAHHTTMTVLRDQPGNYFHPIGHLPEQLEHSGYEHQVDLVRLAVDCAPQFPECDNLDDVIISRAAVSHLFGSQLHTERPRRDRFDAVFVETAYDLTVAANTVGMEQALVNGCNTDLVRIMWSFEPYLPLPELPDGVAPQISGYLANSAFTTLLEEYVPPKNMP